MAQPPTALEVWSTVQAVIAAAAGVDAEGDPIPVIWRYQSADQPPGDYVDLSLGSYLTDGIDFTVENDVPDWTASTAYAVTDRVINDGGRTYSCTTAGISAGSGGPTGTATAITDGTVVWAFVAAGGEQEISLVGVREVALQLEVWSSAIIEQTAKVTALSRCDQIVGLLRMPTARDALAVVGFTPFDPGAVNWLPSIVAVNFRGRATCDIRCRVPAYALRQFTSYIASLTGTVTVDNDGTTLTVPIAAP